MIADKIRILREQKGMTQSEVAKKLGITRSGVNAWEMGISVPSTQYIIQLALLFRVSTDFLLNIEQGASINIDGLSDRETAIVAGLVEYFRSMKKDY